MGLRGGSASEKPEWELWGAGGDGNEEFRGKVMTDPATKTGSGPVWHGRLLLVFSLDFAPNPMLIVLSKLLKDINILADTVDRTIKDTK